MSLIHWWPLNGDLKDYGINNAGLTNNGATVNNSGKIGKCYKMDTYMYINNFTELSSGDFSICYWVKYTSYPMYNEYCICINGTSSSDMLISLGICGNGTADSVGYLTVNASPTTTTLNKNQWYHVCLVYKGNDGYLYLDGQYIKKYTSLSINRNATNLTLNGRNGSRPTTTGTSYLNDMRIYNHALSAKEVKEISKGLVLHYDFEENINILANVEPYPTFDTSAANGGWSHWGSSGNEGYYSQNNDTNYIYPGFSNYSHKVGNSIGATRNYLLYHENIFDGGYRAYQAIIKSKNGELITENICYPTWNGRVDGSIPNDKWTSVESLGNGFYLCKAEGIKQKTNPSGTNDHLVGIYVTAGNEIYVTCCYLENNRTICSDIFFNHSGSIRPIVDSSGYGYNGTVVGNPQIVYANGGSGKYCLDLVASEKYVKSTKLNFVTTGTVVVWAKYPSSDTSNSKMILAEDTSTTYYFAAANSDNLWYHNSAGSITAYRDGTANNKLIRDDKWHCYVFTGVNLSSWPGNLNICYYGGYSNGYQFHGYIGDIKIYNTILSASDILAEYNRKASIDKSGILFTGEFEEGNSTNINVTKTAMVKCNNIVEGTTNVKFLEGYTQLEYLESTGTQYIDTGAVLGNNFELILDQENNLGTGNEYLCGSSSAGKMIGLLNNRLWTNGVVYTTVEVGKNVRQVIGTKITTDGSNGSDYRCTNYTTKSFMKGHSSYTPSGTGSTLIFGTGSARASFKCFNCKIFNNEMLVRDLIPVKRKSDNVLGLYDLVNRQFYTNSGTGTFTAGPEIGKINAIYANEIKEI